MMKYKQHDSAGEQERTNRKLIRPTNTISFEEACGSYLIDTEIRVLKLIASGFTCGEIADRLGNKTSTIQTHRRNIKKKLGLRGYGSLERWCWEHEDEIRKFTF